MKRFIYLAAMAIAVFAIALSLPSWLPPMQAVPAPILLSQNVNFKPPDVKAPGNLEPGTHRGPNCPNDLSIIPLIPEKKIGLTLAESPKFFAYVSPNSTEVEFTLQTEDGTGTEVYKTAFTVNKPGIVEVSIPQTGSRQTSLEVKKPYLWSFSVACSPGDSSGNYSVQGFVQRIEPQESLKKDLENPDPMALAIAYAKNGIWYETLATLAQMRRTAPDDSRPKAEWTQFLQSQKLQLVADKPLTQSF